jgi:N-acetylmuramoyl-L-alanine amidase
VNFIDRLSPNFDERGGAAPSFLILHYTETTLQEADDFFMNASADGRRVSAHYMVDEDGTAYRYVDESKRAWHAGVSYWDGIENLNAHSIGIEIVNPGHANGYRPFPAAQMKMVAELCKEIMARHNIPADHVLAHSDIAPSRKKDPGELFDWSGLAAQGVGVWPVPLKEDFEKAATMDVRAALTAIGYNPNDDLETVLTAFQRHYHPEIFKTPEKVGQPEPETLARLSRLQNLKLSP